MEDTCSVPSSSVKNSCAHCNSDPDRCKLHETTSEPLNENHIPDFESGDNVPGSVQEIGQASAFDRKPSTVLYGLHNDTNVCMNIREVCGQESIIAHNVINDDRSNTKPRCENEPGDIDFGSVESLRCSDFEGSVTNIHVMVDVTENENIDANDEKGTTTEENLVRRSRAKEIGTQTEGMDPFTYDFNRILNSKYTDGNCQGKYFKETSSDGETVEIKNDESACVGGFGTKEYACDETNITSEHLHSHCNDHFDVIDFGLTCPHFNIIMTEQNKRSDHNKTAIGNFMDTAFCEPNKESVIDTCDYLIPFRAEYTNTVKFKLDTESNKQQVELVQDKKRALKENNSILADREMGQHIECHSLKLILKTTRIHLS
ncbi:hypothetical protein DPMN_032087 [Dreissena polymorpha]|uniref:Uncharacterized protein n=1 Tax=Dreissena polymorpha TaxID=45954 RepID=A0A9D4M4B7_DREPO|nr:hypothetical protein DPMN_032087 [Dreissena polymorpha]